MSFKKHCIYLFYVCMHLCVHVPQCEEWAVRTLKESMLPLYHVNPRDRIHRADGCLYSVYFFIFKSSSESRIINLCSLHYGWAFSPQSTR